MFKIIHFLNITEEKKLMNSHLLSIFIHKIKLKTYSRDKMIQNTLSNEYHDLVVIISCFYQRSI